MMLIKRNYLIDIINYQANARVKVTVRFFNVENHVIHTGDKTEIEIDVTVTKLLLYIFP